MNQATSYSLNNKTIAITGSTGDLMQKLCPKLLDQGAKLLFLNRSLEKTTVMRHHLKLSHPNGEVSFHETDLSDPLSVKNAIAFLKEHPVDIFILGAGIYQVERHRTDFGYDNIFTVNFLSHYILVRELLEVFRANHTKVVTVGSIAYRYSKSDVSDPDFVNKTGCAVPYGNSKRYLMTALGELLKDETEMDYVICHPGVAFTNMSAHYPDKVYKLMKKPLETFLAKPEDAVESIYAALTMPVPKGCWVGPEVMDTWGKPTVSPIGGIEEAEQKEIFETAEKLYEEFVKMWE